VEGVYRFLGRVWRLFIAEESLRALEEGQTLGKNPDALLAALKLSPFIVGHTENDATRVVQNSDAQVKPTPAQKKLLHATIKAVTNDIEALSFNTAIARLMEFMNEATTWEQKPRAVLEPFVLLLSPFAPHLAEELWSKLGYRESLAYVPWPNYDESLLIEQTVTVVLQVNGKVRDKIDVPAGLPEAELQQRALANEKVQAFMTGKQVKKIIVVPNKLVNIAVS
jgi:leucyl-tRNA synthetase